MRTTTTLLGDYEYEAVNPNGNKVHIDMRPAEEKTGQSPTELLLSGLSGCAAVDLVQMLKKRKRTVNGLKIEADGTRREEHPRAFTHIKLHFILDSPDATQEEFEKLGHMAATKYCSVAGSLSAEIDHEFTINR
ncbi:OsmC family protein [Roseivirga pacifica]|jgi:putative redox protein|uniref:OsmC family protein n=1 Tax=Roseivirga pacifica TaxID=1267423 RepID=UPI0020942C55|nr:OsmC family protein [Roseivirga pacifica]MCO6360209.1 OsmC family peroxiredoxin [Roseivirga pacifica]MCO6367580.1 OsmC family peroxiredoxin [Roseivirga pacifica]MCO6369888.1 OsmC family peroxiredoxin [Roseivirga pacifica]MCO6375237.1 OsmC family peroxiredoxin [Roseivirga pacifica]MCO6380495.1 OsmC family peroxiredoxin [Roseivirga pacifica]